MTNILIIEDDDTTRSNLADRLTLEGFRIRMAASGEAGLLLAKEEPPNLVLCDINMPGLDGYGVLHAWRAQAQTAAVPFIFLTCKSGRSQMRAGMNMGADDYLTKPFSPKELILRIQAVLKRSHTTPGPVDFSIGPFRFDKNSLKFYLDNQPVDLTSTEFKLLLFLCERPGIIQQRNDLLRSLWGFSDSVHTRTLDTHMKRLRQKLGPHGSWLETVRGSGYRLLIPTA